jgi:hypothetical protein
MRPRNSEAHAALGSASPAIGTAGAGQDKRRCAAARPAADGAV